MNTILPKFIKPVDNKLLRGEYVISPRTIHKLKQNDVTQIIDLRNSSPILEYIEKIFCNIFNIKYHNLKYPHRLNDLPSEDFLLKIADLIKNNEHKTYMHCHFGRRRTGICTAFYELQTKNKTKDVIINEMLENDFLKTENNRSSKNKLKKYTKLFNDFIDTYM